MAIDFSKYRKADIERKLKRADLRPLDMMVTGVTGAGKSTTLNSFFKKTVAKVGNGVSPETMGLEAYTLNNAIRLWDTPGLGDGVKADKRHKEKILKLLYHNYLLDGNSYGFIDMVLVIIEGANRDMGTTYELLNEIIVPNIQRERILVIVNQADIAMKGYHWNNDTMEPDTKLLEFLEDQSLSIQRRVKEATGINILKPVYYSAEYGYNVKAVLDFIIDNIPTQRRKIINKKPVKTKK